MARWALDELRRAGLANVRKEPVMEPRWVRGPRSGERLELLGRGAPALGVTALGGSIGTAPAGVSGELVVVHTFEELEALPRERVAGRLVLWDVPMRRDPDGMFAYGAVAPYRSRGASAAARKGAVASLLRSIGIGRAQMLHTGAMRYEAGVPQVPAAAVTAEDADLLARLAARGPLRLRLQLPCRTLPDVIGHTVIGEVPGRTRPGEIVPVGAHLDRWDLGRGAGGQGLGLR